MSDRRERIPAAEVPDPKLWKLPFWTEPDHIIHAEEVEEEDNSEVLIEEEEIELEPITAEQLEAIRQEAYNEGLEQGLVEGRQKGEKLGFDDGHADGIKQGTEAGETLGYEAGTLKGEKQAVADGDNKSAELSSKLHACMRNMEKAVSEQKSAIEAILPNLVISLAQAVVTEELNQGSDHIVSIVQQALNALPTDTKGLTIECNSQDLEYLENAQIDSDFDAKFKTNKTLSPGGCKINSRYSSVDFTLSERWDTIVDQYHTQLQLGDSQLEDIQKAHKEESEEKEKLAKAQAELEAQTELEAQAESEIQAEAKTASSVELEVEDKVELNVALEAQAAEPQAEPQTEPEIESLAEPDIEPQITVDVQAESPTEPSIEPESQAQVEVESEVEAESQTVVETQVESEQPANENVEAKIDSSSLPEDQPKADEASENDASEDDASEDDAPHE
jgi:flagellar assembly protein FliH